jgi:hypothetical protein
MGEVCPFPRIQNSTATATTSVKEITFGSSTTNITTMPPTETQSSGESALTQVVKTYTAARERIRKARLV